MLFRYLIHCLCIDADVVLGEKPDVELVHYSEVQRSAILFSSTKPPGQGGHSGEAYAMGFMQ